MRIFLEMFQDNFLQLGFGWNIIEMSEIIVIRPEKWLWASEMSIKTNRSSKGGVARFIGWDRSYEVRDLQKNFNSS